MLLNFSVQNFRSFGEEQTLNMFANPKESGHDSHLVDIPQLKQKALRLGIIYGPNAGGKSSLVKAMRFFAELVLGQTTLSTLSEHSHRFTQEQPTTSFEVTVRSFNRVYIYGIDVTPTKVSDEWLIELIDGNKEIDIYQRKGDVIRLGKRVDVVLKNAKTFAKTLNAFRTIGIKSDQLLLAKLSDLPATQINDIVASVFIWFANIMIVNPQSVYRDLLGHFEENKSFRGFCSAFLGNVGTGANGIDVNTTIYESDTVPPDVLRLLGQSKLPDQSIIDGIPDCKVTVLDSDPSKILYRFLTVNHRVSGIDYQFRLEQESDGTQRCLHLLPLFDSQSSIPQLYIVDEFDRSLHPHLSREFIRLFAGSKSSSQNQLIVTTHETNLLDQELIRRDEVWFAEKNQEQQTRLTSLSDYSVRNDLRLDKGYLQGRFGGIPFIGDSKRLQTFLDAAPKPTVKKRAKKKAKPQA